MVREEPLEEENVDPIPPPQPARRVIWDEDELDPWIGSDRKLEPTEEVEEVCISDNDQTRVIRVRRHLNSKVKAAIISWVKENQDVLAWSHSDMNRINCNFVCHTLNIDVNATPVRQKQRPLGAERAEALKLPVEKLSSINFIWEVLYPIWLANPVLVPKLNGMWRTCNDFTDLNKPCPKDCFPLPRINQMVDATSGYEDVPEPIEKEHGGLHKRHADDLAEAFAIIRKYGKKLNPKKCTFGVASEKFLGFIVSSRGIEANPDKIWALFEMPSPQKHKDVQSLTGRIAALSHFVSKSTDKCIPFFNILCESQRFEWTTKCEEAFHKLKEHLA
ncbi:uncharacterized protein LOC133815314 [Humulus lupulus]|uniref:uncharacterized protein LOC133815314 n=1 Tax=Humulus lupulus TaxID=3486 RepID=UPI002B40C6A7|nr:uncharacterized protein LOC133815314 [Humulus lupulus]